MSLTFSDSLAHDAANVFVNVDEFGETVTWRSRNGEEQTVRAVIAPRQSRQAASKRPAANGDTDSIERVAVTVCRDATQTGALTARPEIGDAMTRSTGIDPDSRPWIFAGECEAFDAAAARYVLERARKQVTTRR
jgi:hypothetical protein